jgi:phosphoglycolate phosphatase
MPFDLNIFDYDGVLVDSLDEVVRAGNAFCRSIGHECIVSKHMVTTLQPMTYDQLARSIGLPPDQREACAYFVFNRLQERGAATPLFPGVESLFHHLAARRIVIISGNSRDVISTKLAAHALDEQVAAIFGAHEPGDKADKIRRACADFNAKPGRTCMIGDSISDIQYAKNAGVQSIAVTWGWQSRATLAGQQPDHIVESVGELQALLE